MGIKNYFFDGGNVTASLATQGTATPDNYKRKITAAAVCNTTAGAINFTAHVIPSGGAAATTNRYISARTIDPGETYLCPELVGRGMNGGGFVQAVGSVTGLTFKYEAFDISNG